MFSYTQYVPQRAVPPPWAGRFQISINQENDPRGHLEAILLRLFSTEVPSSQMTLDSIKLTKQALNTEQVPIVIKPISKST